MQDLAEILRNNPYPGRGIAVGDGVVYYFIMGRSLNSRNRIFSLTDDGIQTEAHDPALVEDPSLIIYHPVRTMGDALVVTNGDQTDTIVEAGSFRDGCMAREYEPDAPNFTPRISAIVNGDEFQLLGHRHESREHRVLPRWSCRRERNLVLQIELGDYGVAHLVHARRGTHHNHMTHARSAVKREDGPAHQG